MQDPPGPGRHPPRLGRHLPRPGRPPPGPGNLPWTRQTPQDQADPPRTMQTPLDQADPPNPPGPGRPLPPQKQTPAYSLRAAGTHPTGMHSCLKRFITLSVDYRPLLVRLPVVYGCFPTQFKVVAQSRSHCISLIRPVIRHFLCWAETIFSGGRVSDRL